MGTQVSYEIDVPKNSELWIENLFCSPGYESEEENKGLSEEEIKQKLQEEFAATMAENERMLKEMEQKWEEKLEEAAKENREKVENKIICFICWECPELVYLLILKNCHLRVQVSCEARLIINISGVGIFK